MDTIYLEQMKRMDGVDTITEYKVTKMVGSVRYSIGQVLPRSLVLDLCDQTGVWKVVIS